MRKRHVPAAAGCALPVVVAAAFAGRLRWVERIDRVDDVAGGPRRSDVACPVGVAFRLNAPPESIRGFGAGIWAEWVSGMGRSEYQEAGYSGFQ